MRVARSPELAGKRRSAATTHNAEAADLALALALGVKVGTTLTTTEVETGQGILEDLLETKELQDREVDSGVEAETALVGAESGVEL